VGQATDDNMAHAHCMLDTLVYKYSHSRYVILLGFPTATVVPRTCLNVTLYVHRLSRYVLLLSLSWLCNRYLRCYFWTL